MTDQPETTTHFGFETVPEREKAGRVQGVFSSVASKYDIMNDVMSMGIHRIWKDAMMDWLAPRPGQRLLDVAGGTGDISFRFLKRAGHGHSTVLDITESMLIEGRKRAEAERMSDSLDWVVGDAMALPFDANTFDVYTISFGIRNVTRPQEALNEAYRVLKPGGRLVFCTCSLLPDEGEVQVEDALTRHPNITVEQVAIPGIDPTWATQEGGLRLRPDYWAQEGGMDGFYIAMLRKPA